MLKNTFILCFILTIISGCNSNPIVTNNDISSKEVCDKIGHKYESENVARELGLSDAEFDATYCTNSKSIHYTWDMNEDGINDCEENSMCDHTEDYSIPRYEIPGVKNSIVFDKRSGKWVDKSGICHSCIPENGFKKDGSMDESMFEKNTKAN